MAYENIGDRADGFIGAYVVAALNHAGHEIVACARRPEPAKRRMPYAEWRKIDFNEDTSRKVWRDRLVGIDAVINCAGILQSSRNQSSTAVHTDGPVALFDACALAGVKRIIQISALGIEAETEFARSKTLADDHLAGLKLDWFILRPSLVYAPGAYGGTALFRAVAALPFVTPVPGDGEQQFQPIAMSDLTDGILDLLKPTVPARRVIVVAGPDHVSLQDILGGLREWMGLRPSKIVRVPMAFVRFAAVISDLAGWLGARGSLRSTAISQLDHGNTAPVDAYAQAFGREPMSFSQGLARHPSQTQDRWHAWLYFVRPALRITMALFWVFTGLISLTDAIWQTPGGRAIATMFPQDLLPFALWGGASIDICLGALLFVRWRVSLICMLMLAVTAAYLIGLSIMAPTLWIDPLGPMIKMLPIAVALLVIAAIDSDR